ncbi:MAG TPA: DUF1003 domain-containing protein [Usitatibacteraceae bacterium]|nr:DUF1003 domain-containing protein [Usitatibacteraceae bacterium]
MTFRAAQVKSQARTNYQTLPTSLNPMKPAPAEEPPLHSSPLDAERDQISQNLKAILEFYTREQEKLSSSQRLVERFSGFIGRPAFLGIILVFAALWIVFNAILRATGSGEFDPPPYFWLQGIVSLGALITTNVVLATQNRLAQLEERRAHLDLKVTLLTEQKAAKLIDLLEELRRDLPGVPDRHDPAAAALQQSMNPDLVLAALDEQPVTGQPSNAAERSKDDAGGD